MPQLHKGDLYPVAFRRDVSLNKDSTHDRWPRGLDFRFGNMQGSWGGSLQLTDFFYSKQVNHLTANYIEWEGIPKTIYGRTVYMNAQLVAGVSDKFRFRIQLKQTSGGDLMSFTQDFYEKAAYARNNWVCFPAQFPQPSIITTIGSTGVINTREIAWAAWNTL